MDVGSRPAAVAAVVVIAVLVVARTRQWRLALPVGAAFLVATATAWALKWLIGRDRPPPDLALVQLAGSSMPSTNAAQTAAVAVAVVLVFCELAPRPRRTLAFVLIAAVVWVGACVVYLGGHWLTDVLVGWALGSAIGVGVTRVRYTARTATSSASR